MIYIFGIVFFIGIVLAIIRAEPEEKKPRKPKKKNFFGKLGEPGILYIFPLLKSAKSIEHKIRTSRLFP